VAVAVDITPEHARQFREEGFFVLRGIVPARDLDTLRGECQRVIEEREREMDRLGVDKIDLDHRGRHAHLPYLTCWVALDDMTEANGTVYLLPYSRAGSRDVVKHVRDEKSNDLVGYFGDDPGDPVLVPAGSIACFSSTLLHRSGINATDRMRRVYVAHHGTRVS